MHIGTLRTALFDYFVSRQSGGAFVLRVEDTDRNRMVEGATESLLRTFKKMGIQADEGLFIDEDGAVQSRGEFGPYVQSERLGIYEDFIRTLLEQDDAYYCFCSKERLDEVREAQKMTKQTTKYDRACLGLDADDIKTRLDAGESHVVRMRVPEGETVFEDVVRGRVRVSNQEVDDQVLIKADGFPTYHFAVVVDDHLMKISHILRGEEWISSTPKQVILYGMFGWDVPKFAHTPNLLNADKTKLSKRQGDVAVEDYLEKGYLPEALINFVGTLGFNPRGDREIYTLEELVEMFDLSKVKPAGAVMNVEKLDWMNNQYLSKLEIDEVKRVAEPFVGELSDERLRAAFVEVKRVDRLDQLEERLASYGDVGGYDGEILVWKKSDAAAAKAALEHVRAFIDSLDDAVFEDAEKLESEILRHIEERGVGKGEVLWPLRVSLSGLQKSPSPFELLWVHGKDGSVARIDDGIVKL